MGGDLTVRSDGIGKGCTFTARMQMPDFGAAPASLGSAEQPPGRGDLIIRRMSSNMDLRPPRASQCSQSSQQGGRPAGALPSLSSEPPPALLPTSAHQVVVAMKHDAGGNGGGVPLQAAAPHRAPAASVELFGGQTVGHLLARGADAASATVRRNSANGAAGSTAEAQRQGSAGKRLREIVASGGDGEEEGAAVGVSGVRVAHGSLRQTSSSNGGGDADAASTSALSAAVPSVMAVAGASAARGHHLGASLPHPQALVRVLAAEDDPLWCAPLPACVAN